jgi:uncharacterized membrane protein
LISASKPNKASDNLNLKLSDVLSLNTGSSDAFIDSNINVFDLARTSITVAGQNAPYKVNISTNILGVTSNIQYGAIPKIAMGPGGRSAETNNWCTGATTAQATMSFGFGKGLLGGLLKLATLNLLAMDVKMKISIGSAEANVDYIEPTVQNAGIHFIVNTSPATLSITNNAETENGFIGIFEDLPGEFGLRLGTAGKNIQKSQTPVNKYVSTPVTNQFIPSSSETQGALAGLLNSIPRARLVTGIRIPFFDAIYNELEKLLDSIETLIMSTIGDLLSKTIDPLLRALGINLGSADIMLYDIRTVPSKLVNVVDV